MATPPSPKLTSAPNDGSSTISTTVATPGRGHLLHDHRVAGGDRGERRPDGVGVGQVQPHAAEVGPVPQPGRGRLQHDRVADLLRRGDRRLGVGDRAGAQQRHPVGGQQRDQLVVGEVAARRARRPAPRARRPAAGRLVDVGQLGQLADRTAPPAGVLGDLGQRDDRPLRRRVRRHRPAGGHAVLVEDGELRRDALGGQEAGHDRLGRPPATPRAAPGRTPASRPCSGGRKTATTASTPSSSTASCSAARKSSGVPSAPMSTGSSRASSSPCSRTASATSTPMAVELPTIATRVAGRQRLVGQQRADVEHLRHGLDPDDPGGGEQRGHRLLGHRDRGAGQPAR